MLDIEWLAMRTYRLLSSSSESLIPGLGFACNPGGAAFHPWSQDWVDLQNARRANFFMISCRKFFFANLLCIIFCSVKSCTLLNKTPHCCAVVLMRSSAGLSRGKKRYSWVVVICLQALSVGMVDPIHHFLLTNLVS